MSGPLAEATRAAPADPVGGEEPPLAAGLARFRQRLRGNRQLLVGAALLLGYVGVAVVAMLEYGNGLTNLAINPYWANEIPPPGPTALHPFGIATGIGVDVFRSLVQATPIDLAVVGGTTVVAVVAGLFLGAYAGLAGGAFDLIVTELSDLLASVPPFFFVMVLFLGVEPFLGPDQFLWAFAVLFLVVLLPYHARPVRSLAQQVAGEPYVESARASGATSGRLLVRHVVPNSIYPVLAQVPVDVYNVLFVLTAFQFLHCFVPANYALLSPLPSTVYPEWGLLLGQGACYGWSPIPDVNFWWMYAFPAAVVILFGVAVTLFCDGLERFLAGRTVSR